jgi:hypothetical protein
MKRLSEHYTPVGTSELCRLSFDGMNKYSARFKDDKEVVNPTVPSAPSYSSSIQDYISNYPKIFDLMKQYSPQEAALQKETFASLYPEQAGLTENLAGIANKGMNSGAPDWYKNQMQDTLSAKFGRAQVFNPLGQQAYGAEYQSGLQNWQKYYSDLGLSLSGKTPLYGANTSMTQSYQPNQAAAYNQANYGNYLNAWGQANPAYTQNKSGFNSSGMLGGAASGAYMGSAFGPWGPAIGAVGGGIYGGLS